MTKKIADLKILLAEDAGTMRKIEISILKSIGCNNIIEAEDGAKAKKLLQNRKGIDLVISDWNMPNMSGLELLTWMRTKSKNFTKLPFIMATAQSDKAQVDTATKAGATAVVAKPFSPEELQTKIEQALAPATKKATGKKNNVQKTSSGKVTLRAAHLQITDHLLLGLLKDQISRGQAKPKHFNLQTKMMTSWNPVSEALENGEVDVAFMLAPIAMDLFHHEVPINVAALAHRGGSIMVRNAKGSFKEPYQDFFRKKSFLIPHKLSIHHMLSHMFFKGVGLKASLDKGDDIDVNFEVAAPITMPSFLAENKLNAGFMVAEPIGSKAVKSGIAQRQFMSSELWPDHPCCVVAMRRDFIENSPDAAKEFVQLLVDIGRQVLSDVSSAAKVGVGFLDPAGKLGLTPAVLESVINAANGIRWDNLYPEAHDFTIIQDYMGKELNADISVDLSKFIDKELANIAAGGSKKTSPKRKMPPPKKVMQALLAGNGADAAAQVSLKQLLFDKGVDQQKGGDLEQFKELSKNYEALAAENKELQEKITTLEDQLQELSKQPALLFKRGIVHLKEEELFEAAGLFNAVLAYEPENVKAHNNLAVIYYELDEFEKARATLEKVLELEPDNATARDNLEMLLEG